MKVDAIVNAANTELQIGGGSSHGDGEKIGKSIYTNLLYFQSGELLNEPLLSLTNAAVYGKIMSVKSP
ncbi:hypothetical protein AGMMS50276_19440 [Synergistales bacterium]|nr:hypothetical protein AGMMS50276_19440 [Synergistales bacterium]